MAETTWEVDLAFGFFRWEPWAVMKTQIRTDDEAADFHTIVASLVGSPRVLQDHYTNGFAEVDITSTYYIRKKRNL